jgi:hypothetical protein
MPQTRTDWLVAVAIFFVLAVLLLSAVTRFLHWNRVIYWVGSNDVEITFVVTDAATDEPIQAAVIHVHVGEGGFCDERDTKDFALTTDEAGTVKRISKQCMCSGNLGRGRDSYGTHVPRWLFEVSAPGYHTNQTIDLDIYSRSVKRGELAGGIPARLVVPVSLKKRP